MKAFSVFFSVFSDLALRVLPYSSTASLPYAFGFLVHPRDDRDVFRKFPFLRYLPASLLRIFLRNFWPVTVSKVTGLRDKGGAPVGGYVFSIPLTARMLLEDKEAAHRSITAALRLAKRRGVKLIGLGGLTSSVTGGGLTLLPEVRDIAITTGHAYTAVNVTNNLFALATRFSIDPRKAKVAIVGAAGSIGASCARILVSAGYTNFRLIDLARKKERFEHFADELKAAGASFVDLSHQIGDIQDCDLVIAATNAPEALIVARDLKPGAIVIDDAQPSDVADDVFDRSDILAIEAGVVHTPGISMNFNMGLKNREDLFCCLAEVLILAAERRDEHYVIHRATADHIDEIRARGDSLGFRIAAFQNRFESISEEKLAVIGERIKENGIQF